MGKKPRPLIFVMGIAKTALHPLPPPPTFQDLLFDFFIANSRLEDYSLE